MLVSKLKESRLMILNLFLRVNAFLFWLYYNFYCTSRANIDLTSGTGKTVATGLVNKIPLE